MRLLSDTSSFNEAEAIKPRNRRSRTETQAGSRTFNEAEAIKPRNPADQLTAAVREGKLPSMRPRQSSLGIPPVDVAYRFLDLAAFNEAEAIKPRNHRAASWFASLHCPPSMRPRQSSLGISPPSNSFRGLSYFDVLRALGFVVPKVQETLLRNRHELLVSPYRTREKCDASTAHDFRVTGAFA